MSDEHTPIFTLAHVLPGLENDWLQHLRDFDTAHPGCHFEVITDVPGASYSQIIDMLCIEPSLTLHSILARKKPE